MAGVLTRRDLETQRHTPGEDGHVNMETQTEVMLPQYQNRQQPPEVRRGKEGFFPGAFGGSMDQPTP